MTLLLVMLTAVSAWAAEWPKYITDVILVGGESQSEANSLKNSHSDYTFINVNLNDGAGGDYIYLGYKTSNTANTNGGYITALYLTTKSAGDCSQTLTFGGVEYTRTPCYGSSHFVNDVKGDLNSNAGGEDIHLYYTKNNYSDKRVISDIKIISSTSKDVSTPSGFTKLGFNGGTSDCDLNDDAGGNYVYMYFKSDYKVNRPYPEPSMASNLVYTGSPLKLISSTYTNNNTGTLYYRVGTSGSYTSTVNDVTATNAGTYTVYYYSGSNSYGNSSESYAHSKTVTIGKAQNSGATVVCADALESDGPSPSVTGNLSGGAITYTYATSQSGSYSATAPSTEGTYWVKATIAGDNNYIEYTTAAVSFKLKHDWGVHNTGNTANDAYVISTTEDLNLLASRVNAGNTYQNKFFKLNASLTYDGTANNFTPIGVYGAPFAGTFDGNRKTISGLNINLGSNKYVGLFGYADNNATIKNLKLTNSTISGNSNVGAILGCGSSSYPNHTNVENCEVASDVNVSGSASAVGGITGAVANVRGCVSAASVSGFSYIGGIVGNSNGITISQCLYTGTSISSGEIYKGAITGKLDETTTILIANYYTADLDCKAVTNSNDIDGARRAVAINTADGVTVTPTGDATVYNVSGITAYASNSGLLYNGQLYAGATERVRLTVGYTAPADYALNGYTDGHDNALTANDDDTYTLTMTDETATVTPDGVSLWGTASGADGSQDHPYVITTPAGLDLLATNVNGGNYYDGSYFVLGADIAYDKTVENNYTTIGDNQHSFRGTFDGQGHTISGIRISAPNGEYKAIFGMVDGTVKNLVVSDCSMEAYQNIGGIVVCLRGTIENCHVGSDVTLTVYSYVGGITGKIEGGTIKGCTSAATITGTKSCGNNAEGLGGIVGFAANPIGITPTLTDNLFTGTISGDLDDYIGAIVGWNESNAAILTNNYHTSSGMGGVGNDNDATDEDGAQFAYEFPTANGAMGAVGSTYGTGDYTGITAYANGLAYNGKYYCPLPWTGDGTAEHPFVISTTDGLDKLAIKVNGGTSYSGTYFELGNDIDYSEVPLTLDGGKSNYTAIGKYNGSNDVKPFSGIFDGKGHTISGIRITKDGGGFKSSYQGVFGCIRNATVKNVKLADTHITAGDDIGGIAGFNSASTIENCHVTNTVTIQSNGQDGSYYYGGIAGELNDYNSVDPCVRGCTSAATVSGNSEVGGIVGCLFDGSITDCLYLGTSVTGTYQIGAIVGNNVNNTLSNNSHTLSGVGGCDGSDVDGACFAYEYPAATDIMGTAGTTYGTGDYTGITAYTEGLAYNGKYYCPLPWTGDGTAEHPFVISTTDGLNKLAIKVNAGTSYSDKYFELGNDIDYSDVPLTLDGGKSNYTPIGDDYHYFYGTFDGKGHKVSGIRISNTYGIYKAIFGKVDGTVKNLVVSDCSMEANDWIGGIVSYLQGGTIENCHVLSDVTLTGNGYIGGIAGYAGGTVKGCTSAATIIGTKSDSNNAERLGGIVGYAIGSTSTLTDNLFTGTISGDLDKWIGAIVGWNYYSNAAILTNNYHTLSGMGGVGNENDATSSDEDGATIAYELAAANGAMGAVVSTYGTGDYTGITAYENGLAYNGKYYCPSLWGGSGTEADPYVIYNTEGLDKLATNVNGGNDYQDTYFVLGNDIVYAPDVLTLDLDGDGNNDSNYMPVGNGSSFYGNFDGQGHTISGISVNANGMDYIGVFGFNDGTVKNLTFSDCLFAGSQRIGAIAGFNRGTVENCHVAAYVSVTGNNGVGGVVGNNEGSVLGCTSAAALSTKEYADYFGGIAGSNAGTLTDNLFTGTIGKMPDSPFNSGIGAITGYHNTELGSTLTNNFHTCSGVGGVGNDNDATNTDQDGAQLAISSTTKPAAITGDPTTTYAEGETYEGITAYENGLFYDGKYYWHEAFLRGDANGDGQVTITDAVAVVNYILGNPSENFNKAAANVNGDTDEHGEPIISITDAVGVVNIILNNGASAPELEVESPAATQEPE